ncbi:flippase [Patulibacter sp.]|uniref:flippase n=1 Tax=Patulibacter sp. TaxID=1912859 RepID=UPI00272162AC|nr:flippase [Patulibacter sp.]MDO9408196.1 flippase [Patulibacter sp.]
MSSGPIPPGVFETAGPAPDLIDSDEAGGAALRGGALRTVGFAAGLMLSLVSAPLVIRHLGDAEFGRYSAVLAVVAIVGGLTEGGVNTVALRELAVARDRDQRDRLMGDLLGLRLVLTATGVILAVGFAVIAGYGPSLVAGTALAGLGLIGALAQSLLASVLQSQLRFGWATIIDLLRQIVTTGLIVVLVIGDAGVVPFLAVSIPAGLASLAVTIVLIRGSISLRPAFHPNRWLPLLRDTAVFAVAVAVNTLYFRITLVLMSVVAAAVETGYFAVSFRVMEVLVNLPAILLGAAFPIISRTVWTDRPRFEQTTARMFTLALMLGTLISVALVLGAPFAIEVLAGSQGHPSTAVLQIQAAGIIATFLASATGYPLLSLHRNKETLAANLVCLATAIALTLALTPTWGAKGAAVSAVSAEFFLAAVTTFALVRRGGVRVPLIEVPIVLLAGLAALGVGLAVGIHPAVQAAVGSLAFLLILQLTGRFPAEVRELLARRVPGR